MTISDRILVYSFLSCIACFIIAVIVVASLPRQTNHTVLDNIVDRPAFFASLTRATIQLVYLEDVIKFDHVWTNIQNGYDPKSGIFTAPREGLYFFTSTFLTAGNKKLAVQLNKNNEMLVSGFVTDKNGAANTMTAIVNLTKGDKVYVKHRDSIPESMYGGYHSAFSGYMVQ